MMMILTKLFFLHHKDTETRRRESHRKITPCLQIAIEISSQAVTGKSHPLNDDDPNEAFFSSPQRHRDTEKGKSPEDNSVSSCLRGEENHSGLSGKDRRQELMNCVIFGIRFEREQIRRRITERLERRFQNGLIEEVQRLLSSGLTPGQLKFYGLEYKFVTLYLSKEISFNAMFRLLNID